MPQSAHTICHEGAGRAQLPRRGGGAGATHTPTGGGMGARDGWGRYARGQRGQGAGYALLSYPIWEEAGESIKGKGASGFGLPTLSIPTAGQPIGRATGQPRAFAAYPPHPSPPPPSAGGHTLFLKGAPLKNFVGKTKQENELSALCIAM
jgi:hypothetical protein